MSARPQPGMTQLLAARIKAVFKRLPKGMAGHEEDLHELRVAARRLRVALPLVALKADGRRVRRAGGELRDLVRAGGAGRDLDVILPLLEERVRSQTAPSPGLLRARRALRAARTRSRGQTGEALMDVEIARLRRDLQKIRQRGGATPVDFQTRLRESRDGDAGAVLRALQALGARYDPEALHRLRRGVRRLRYLAEVQADATGQSTTASRVLKKLQSRLGAINDNHVLTLWLDRYATAAEQRGRAELGREVRVEHEQFRTRGRRLHRELLSADPEAIVKSALRAMGGAAASGGPPGQTASALPAQQPQT